MNEFIAVSYTHLIPVPLLAALTAILAATIVYGVFYTKIVKNVQMFGQLRTLGMTKRQIKRMAGKEGRLYACLLYTSRCV